MKRRVVKFVALILVAGFFLPVVALGATLNDYLKQKDYFTKQAEQARQQALQKQQEAANLKKQIDQVTNQIDETEHAISSTQKQIFGRESSINSLVSRIDQEQKNLEAEKEKLGTVVASWYMEGESDGFLSTLLSSNTFSQVIDEQQYYDSIRQQIEVTIENIEKLKQELALKKKEEEKELSILAGLKSDQESQQVALESRKVLKNSLLNNTQSTITSLKNQEQVAQERIVEIDAKIKALVATRIWGSGIVSSNDSSWYYSQIGNSTKLGASPYTVNQYGCLITSMAMVATFYGHRISPSDIASNRGIFDDDGYLQVNTPPGIGIDIEPSQSVNWAIVNDELANNHPVIVSIYLPSVGKVNRDGSSHFVVIKGVSGGKYLMHDPISDGRGYDVSQVRSMKIVRPN